MSSVHRRSLYLGDCWKAAFTSLDCFEPFGVKDGAPVMKDNELEGVNEGHSLDTDLYSIGTRLAVAKMLTNFFQKKQ